MGRDSARGGSFGKKQRGKKTAAKRRSTAKTVKRGDAPKARRRGNSSEAGPKIEAAGFTGELDEALARQAATSEILRIISQSPADAKPVFDAIVGSIVRLLKCDRAFIMRCEGAFYFPVATATPDGSVAELTNSKPIDPAANFPSRAIVGKKTLYYP